MNSKSLLTLAAALFAVAVMFAPSSSALAQGGIGGVHGGAAGQHPNHANASGFHKNDSWHVHEGGNYGYHYHYNPSVGYYRPYVAGGYYGGYGYRPNWNLGYARSTSPALAAYSNMRNGAYGSYGYRYGYRYSYPGNQQFVPYFPPDPFGNPDTGVSSAPDSRKSAQEQLNQQLNKENK